MHGFPWVMGAVTAASAGKTVVGLRTDTIGIHYNGGGKTYRREQEPFGFYRVVVIHVFMTILMAAWTVSAFYQGAS